MYYCRKCITLKGKEVDKIYNVNKGEYHLNYELTKEQKEASVFILDCIRNNCDCSLNAVCGAGKTEIIYDSIEYCLNNNKKIGIAIPRKDVVIELSLRIRKDFNVNVADVYGGHNDKLEGDVIVFTTHQAFRFIDYFDVLIIDEIDAFPYNSSEILRAVVSKCSKNFVYLSATMPSYISEDKMIKHYYLNKRYHGFKIPLPACKNTFSMIRTLKKQLQIYEDKLVLVYFPTIKIQNKISKKIKYDYLINSKVKNRENALNDIRKMNQGIVLTTTVLERGITIKDVQVIVYNAEHRLFNKDTLIQIAGRVGRSKDYPTGNIIFICKEKNKQIKECIKTIKKCNA